MPVTERRSLTKTLFRNVFLGENTLIAILIAVFFNLHVAGAILRSAAVSGAVPAQEEARPSLYD